MNITLNPTIDYSGLEEHQKYFYHWIVEREKARIGREQNLPKPWTSDPIIQQYRFCNIRREDDKVTKWIKLNWRDPYEGHPNMVTAMVIARLFNRISTLELIGFPETCNFEGWVEVVRELLKEVRSNGAKIWTGAYLVSTNGHSMDKIDYILDRVVKPIHDTPLFRYSKPKKSLQALHADLTLYDGMGSFMAGQVVADLKYTSVGRDAEDWNTWAPIGPGSRRGLNRYFGRKLEGSIKTNTVNEELLLLQYNIRQRLGIDLPVHDVQNCLCEFDKHSRVRLGEGKPRSGYPGK
jgi:hypothetical protein